MTVAGRACDGRCAWLGATAVTGVANIHRGDADFCFSAARRLFQRNLQVVAQVGAPINIGMSASAAKEIAEYIAERIGKALSTCSPHAGIDARMSMLVVRAALPWVR